MFRAPGGMMIVSIHFVGSETLLLDSFSGFTIVKLPKVPQMSHDYRTVDEMSGNPQTSNPGSPHHENQILAKFPELLLIVWSDSSCTRESF